MSQIYLIIRTMQLLKERMFKGLVQGDSLGRVEDQEFPEQIQGLNQRIKHTSQVLKFQGTIGGSFWENAFQTLSLLLGHGFDQLPALFPGDACDLLLSRGSDHFKDDFDLVFGF